MRAKTLQLSLVSSMILALASSAACLKAPPEDASTEEGRQAICEYWPEKLGVGSKVDQAFSLIREAKCANALPILEGLFEDGSERDRVIDAIRDINEPAASTGILKKALKDGKLAGKAASLVQRWRLKDLKGDLVTLASSDGAIRHRKAALDALLAVSSAADHKDLLIKLATANPNLQDFKVHKRAVMALAEIGGADVVEAMITAAFLQNQTKKHIYVPTRKALAKVAKHSASALAKISAGKNKTLHKRIKGMGLPSWELTEGQKITQLLADSLSAEAGLALAKNLARPTIFPKGLGPNTCMSNAKSPKCKKLLLWNMQKNNRRQFAHLGLGKVAPNDEAVQTLVDLTKNVDKSIEGITQRLYAANALSYMGTPKAIRGLFSAFDQDPYWTLPDTDNRKVADFLSLLSVTLVKAIGYEDLAEFDKRISATHVNSVELKLGSGHDKVGYSSKDAPTLKEKLQDPVLTRPLAALRECANDGACWIKKLEDPDLHVFIKAALMLARGVANKTDARAALLKRLKATATVDTDIRSYCLMALGRVGDKTTGRKLRDLAKSSSVTKAYWQTEYTVLANALMAR